MSNPVSPSSRHGSGHPPTPPNPSPMGFDWVDSVEKLAASTILNAPKTPPRRPSSSRFREGSNRRRRHAPRRVPVEAVGATVLRGFAALSSTANPPRASFSMPPSAQSQGIDPPHDGLKPPARPDAPGLDLAGKIAVASSPPRPNSKFAGPKFKKERMSGHASRRDGPSRVFHMVFAPAACRVALECALLVVFSLLRPTFALFQRRPDRATDRLPRSSARDTRRRQPASERRHALLGLCARDGARAIDEGARRAAPLGLMGGSGAA